MHRLDRAALSALIPHRGAMCLLEAVESWSPEEIVCRAVSHRDVANPLRHEGRLPSLAAIEYAAQAMAVHGGLEARERGQLATPGMLVAARDVRLHVDRLDDLPQDLWVRATRLAGDAGGLLYAFRVEADCRALAEGRAVVALRPAEDVTP